MTLASRFGILAAASLLAVAVPALTAALAQSGDNARPACLPHGQFEQKLRQAYQEQKLGRGVSGDGNLVEVYMSAAGSFTVVKTTPAGLSCIVDFGEGWQTIDRLETAWLKQAPDLQEHPAR